MRKIINFCPTGTQTTPINSLTKFTPDKIVEEIHEAYEFGITLVHIHARDSSFNNSYKSDHYRPIVEGIRKHCPDLAICVSLTGRLFPEFEKRSEVLELNPDMGSLTMSSINFPTGASINSPDMILRLIEKMNSLKVVPEIECFDSGMVNYANYLIKKGILKPPYYFNLIFGNMFNAQADLVSIASIMSHTPKESMVCLGGIGSDQLKCNVMGLLYANGIRIGLEDNLYLIGKTKATNMQLLKRIHSIMHKLDVGIMTPLEFKNILKKNEAQPL